MPVRKAEAEWKGNLREGGGRIKLESGSFEGPYDFHSRFEGGTVTNPEELLGAAHAACFTMAITAALSREKITATRIHTTATVTLTQTGSAFDISHIALVTEAEVPGIDAAKFKEVAEGAKVNCPLSKALKAVEISLDATLLP